MGVFSPFQWLVIISALLSAPLYFIPAIVGRKKRNAVAIFWLNFLLGWTVVGRVGALICALARDPQTEQGTGNEPLQDWVRCAGCERYSPPGSKFSSCGVPIAA